jgi:diguanylate cyclase (GGDEF)-like protein
MSTINELIETARANEQIARNLFEIEVEIMNITRCSDFFEQLLVMVKDKFSIEYAWLAMANIPANQYLIESLQSIEFEVPSFVKVPMIDFLQATKSSRTPLLQNDQVGRLRTMLPKEYKPLLGSVAILPLMVERKVVGALMLGSSDKQRYSPKKDHFFLQQLSVKVSLSLVGVWARERVSFLATRDPLTSLRNRRELEETLDQELSRHVRQREHLALMFIDCDDFKLVNDTHGHDVGDLYLKHVAEQLVELTRKSDMVFRFAGDEFVVLLPNQIQSGAEVIAQRIRDHFKDTPLMADGNEVPVAMSYGVVSTECAGKVNSKRLLKLADERLYEMKALKPNSRAKAAMPDDPNTATVSA